MSFFQELLSGNEPPTKNKVEIVKKGSPKTTTTSQSQSSTRTKSNVKLITYKTFLDYITLHEKKDDICAELLRHAEDKKRHWRNPIMKTLEIVNRILEEKK